MIIKFECNSSNTEIMYFQMASHALIRNFIWGGTPDKRVRARVAWDTAIIPTVKGGLKIFDPYAQARALMAKILIRALIP